MFKIWYWLILNQNAGRIKLRFFYSISNNGRDKLGAKILKKLNLFRNSYGYIVCDENIQRKNWVQRGP